MRILSVAALLFFTSCAFAGTGDINVDGSITRADADLALKFAGGLQKPTAAQQSAADVGPAAPDGVVNIRDAVRIFRIVLGVDPLLPASPMPLDTTLTVSGSASPVFTLPGGYPVSGTLTTVAGAVFTGDIAFQDTTSKMIYGPWTLSGTGAFAAVLPAGTYQPIAVTLRQSTTFYGEAEDSDTALAVGLPVTLNGATTGLSLKRANLSTQPTLTLNFSGPSAPYLTTAHVYLADSGTTAGTFRLNDVYRDVTFTPALIGVPAGTYNVRTASQYALSSNAFQDLYIWYAQALTVNAAVSKTLTFPRLYELRGVITAPAANPPLDVYMTLKPVGTADETAAYVVADSTGDYLIAVQPGAHTISVGLTSAYAETTVSFLLPYTMPSANATKNIAAPALPAFRTIAGTVKGPSGAGVSGALVSLDLNLATIPAAGACQFGATATTGANGSFTVHVPDGSYKVFVTP